MNSYEASISEAWSLDSAAAASQSDTGIVDSAPDSSWSGGATMSPCHFPTRWPRVSPGLMTPALRQSQLQPVSCSRFSPLPADVQNHHWDLQTFFHSMFTSSCCCVKMNHKPSVGIKELSEQWNTAWLYTLFRLELGNVLCFLIPLLNQHLWNIDGA